MTNFSFNFDLDGDERAFSLPLADREAAVAVGRDLLNVLITHRSLRNGFISVGQGCGEDVEWIGAWNVSEGCEPVWQAES